eukprot:maker-scaffold_1-snap-gene-15.44-mRNA-1 protein AED:0.00 eAED:0.00 QI:68/1/1/1/1/1/2/419/270
MLFSSIFTIFDSSVNSRDTLLRVSADGTLSFTPLALALLANSSHHVENDEISSQKLLNYEVHPEEENVDTLDSDTSNYTCAICLDKVKFSELVMKCPKNHHFFHKNCLTTWMFYQRKRLENLTGTCPICRDTLRAHAASLRSYLLHTKDMNATPDERSRLERLTAHLNQYRSWFMVHKKQIVRNLVYLSSFLFGVYKGYSLGGWSFTQDVFYFTLPYKMRVATSFGYIIGVLLKGSVLLLKQVKALESVRENQLPLNVSLLKIANILSAS